MHIEAFLKAGAMEDGVVSVTDVGTPQGGVISPWIANLVLDDLDKAIDSFMDKVRTLTRRQQGRNVEAVLADLNPVLRGWARYFGVGEVTHVMTLLDRWIRMRLRAFRFKRKCHNDNWRLPNRRLEKWGLLSLLQCRPALRLSYVRTKRIQRADSGSLQRGNHAGSPSVLTAHAEQMSSS